MKDLWQEMFSLGKRGWAIFEDYTRTLLANRHSAIYKCRPCVGKQDPKYDDRDEIELGGCREIRLVSNIIEAVKKTSNVLFHSTD